LTDKGEASLTVVGLDVGSRTIKLVLVNSEGKSVVESTRTETTYDPVSRARHLLGGLKWDRLVATGYGRKLVKRDFNAIEITEIQAHALGARQLFPVAGSVLDIGGQDTKAIALDANGRVRKFEMNDRCAAGTGKFLEFMASSFQMPVEEFGEFALTGQAGLTINSMCTVFAETEATSLMARGHRAPDIARALHLSVVKRSLSMLRRTSVNNPLVFSGGVALNPCTVELVRELGGYDVLVPQAPDLVGALGAALYGVENCGGLFPVLGETRSL
jgi:(R)-2-hydroxyacyl-CoA dehydratese activating ATPase